MLRDRRPPPPPNAALRAQASRPRHVARELHSCHMRQASVHAWAGVLANSPGLQLACHLQLATKMRAGKQRRDAPSYKSRTRARCPGCSPIWGQKTVMLVRGHCWKAVGCANWKLASTTARAPPARGPAYTWGRQGAEVGEKGREASQVHAYACACVCASVRMCVCAEQRIAHRASPACAPAARQGHQARPGRPG